MIHKLSHLFFYLLSIGLLFLCFMLPFYWGGCLTDRPVSLSSASINAVLSIIGLLVFFLLFIVIYLALHYKRKRSKTTNNNFFHDYMYEIEQALDSITQGNFNVTINKEAYEQVSHKNNHMIELADKINKMAAELNGMETMRENFVSNVSHEIQSPLTSIKGFAVLLKEEDLSHEERLHYISIMEMEIQRLSKLSENLLRLSTLEAEGAILNTECYSLSRQMQDVILMMEPQWSKKNIEVSLDGSNVFLQADKDLMSQVWINLINNSIKFTPEGGFIHCTVEEEAEQITITLSDSGIGMTEETITHIFERFYMADKARSRKAGGSGLGLSIVKRIIQLHNGSIKVTSQPSLGSVFVIRLPRL